MTNKVTFYRAADTSYSPVVFRIHAPARARNFTSTDLVCLATSYTPRSDAWGLRAVFAGEVFLALHFDQAAKSALELKGEAVAAVELSRGSGGGDDEVYVTVV
jgi:hypothetical protein